MKKGKDFIGAGAGAVILNENKQILLLLRGKSPEAGYWTIPGGAIEMFETVEKAVEREVFEETGLIVQIDDLLGVTNHIIPNERLHWIAPCFSVKVLRGVAYNREPTKHKDMQWFNLNNIPNNITITTKKALEYLKQVESKKAQAN